MIARVWRGVTLDSKSDEYLDYVMKTGVRDCRATEGNRGVWVLRKVGGGRAEFLFISLWESFDAKFLLGLDPNVTHYEIMFESGRISQSSQT